MSRCFPFPPPGYEKKPQSDHVELPIKKQKETQHKKEKKDKAKRESKERKDRDKDKEQNKDKHREKKDKKEKHRVKDKGRNKDEKRILYERKDGEHAEEHNDRKPAEDNHQAVFKNAKFTEELGRRIRDNESGAGKQMGDNDTGKVQRRFEGVDRSTKKECTGKEIVHGITISEQKRMGMASAMEEGGTSNETNHTFNGTVQRRLDGVGRPVDKDANKKVEWKEKAKEHKVDGGKGDKHKHKGREKKHEGKDRVRNKENEKEEKIREKAEHKHKEKDKLRDSRKEEQGGSQNMRSLFPPKDDIKSAGADGCPKRKVANGFLHEYEARPNKLPRPASSTQLCLDNGNKSDKRPIGNFSALVRHKALNMTKVEKTIDTKEHKINGVIDIHSPSNMRQPPLISDATENGEIRKKPHPDEKYLSQILCIPKVEEWLKFDDQEWLSSGHDLRQKPKTKLEADETPKVWAEAVRIESTDVLALPYVIPY